MLKIFSELKASSSDLFNECLQAAYKETGSEGWLVLRTWGEIQRTAKYVSEHMFEVDSNKIRSQLTPMEYTFVEGLVNCNRESHIEARKSQHKTMAQRSERFVKWFLENNAAIVELEKLKTKIAGRRMPSQRDDEWAKVAEGLFN